jgi:dihydrofolate reductase
VCGRSVFAVFAGAQAAHALLPYIDEVRLLVYPVLLGAGPPLFSGQRSRLRLVECRPFPMSGAVQLRYRSVR